MSGENQRKRHGDQQIGRPSKLPNTSLSGHPAGKHNSGSGLGTGSGSGAIPTNMNRASATLYENAMNQFEQFCGEYRKAHAEYKANVVKESNKYHANRSRISTAYALALQDIADNAKPEEVQQQKEAKLKEIAREKLVRIEQKFNQAVQSAGGLATTEKQAEAIRKAKNVRNSGDHRARKEAQYALVEPAEVNAIAQTPKGEEIKRKFDKMFENAREGVNNGVTQIETTFINEIKGLIANQQWLSLTMDAANLGDKGLVKLDKEEARASGMVDKTRNAGEIIKSLRKNETDQPRVKVEDGEKKAKLDKGKGRA